MIRKFTAAIITCLFVASVAMAHTPLARVVPKSGSILNESPESVTLQFAQEVRLTQLRIESANAAERPLEYSPKTASAKYTSAAPELEAGRNAIHWTALSPDGHVIEGTIILVLRPDDGD